MNNVVIEPPGDIFEDFLYQGLQQRYVHDFEGSEIVPICIVDRVLFIISRPGPTVVANDVGYD